MIVLRRAQKFRSVCFTRSPWLGLIPRSRKQVSEHENKMPVETGFLLSQLLCVVLEFVCRSQVIRSHFDPQRIMLPALKYIPFVWWKLVNFLPKFVNIPVIHKT